MRYADEVAGLQFDIDGARDLLIGRVKTNSGAARFGFRSGDSITAINGNSPNVGVSWRQLWVSECAKLPKNAQAQLSGAVWNAAPASRDMHGAVPDGAGPDVTGQRGAKESKEFVRCHFTKPLGYFGCFDAKCMSRDNLCHDCLWPCEKSPGCPGLFCSRHQRQHDCTIYVNKPDKKKAKTEAKKRKRDDSIEAERERMRSGR